MSKLHNAFLGNLPVQLERHDSGCKTKMVIPSGVIGDAEFRGERDEHRIQLDRRRGDGIAQPTNPFALWIGLNPSAAEADIDDLTIRKEWRWTSEIGFGQHAGTFHRYVKTNAGSYRLTNSLALDDVRVPLSHADNLPRILYLARQAGVVVLATGSPPDALVPHARAVFQGLKAAGIKPLCLGTTRDGYPKHTSRLGYATSFVEYRL